ncbi:MAG TPA: efflux RND transporter periplasmic adaptor subunit [Vicinamibacteria bacterium]|jgi:RND family efflux transporter MFP subunit|nr:efflux RND transporter periplasmic adaptor subunit [Vicinamibacteria bacterium]
MGLRFKTKHFLIAAPVLIVGTAVLAFSGRASTGSSPKGASPLAAVVRVVPTPLSSVLTLSGEFRPFQEADLHAKVAGYIRKISVDVGDRVKAGQVLAVLEVPELSAQVLGAEASTRRSEDSIRRAQSELEKAESLHAATHSAYARLKEASQTRPGLIAEQELDEAQARDKQAEAQIEVSRAALSENGNQLWVAKAETQRVTALSDYARITAPFAGVITKRYADPGALIQAGTASSTQAMPVVRLADTTKLRLVLPTPESVVPQVHLGTVVRVRVPTLGRTFEGRVARFADALDEQTRTMRTEIDVDNPDGSIVLGMYAEADLVLAQRDRVLTVPLQAVARTGSEARVLVIGAGDVVEERSVKLGLEGPQRVEVLSGLREGDRVIIGSRSQFRIGDPVTPHELSPEAEKTGEGFS